MEEKNNVIELVEAVEIEGTEKEGFFSKIGSGIKKHKKALAIGAGVVAGVALIGTIAGKLFGQDSYDEDEDYVEFDEEETSDETEEE